MRSLSELLSEIIKRSESFNLKYKVFEYKKSINVEIENLHYQKTSPYGLPMTNYGPLGKKELAQDDTMEHFLRQINQMEFLEFKGISREFTGHISSSVRIHL